MRLHQANTLEEIEVTVADKSQRSPTAACGAEPGRSLKSQSRRGSGVIEARRRSNAHHLRGRRRTDCWDCARMEDTMAFGPQHAATPRRVLVGSTPSCVGATGGSLQQLVD